MTDPPASYPRDVRESFEYCVECESLVVSVDQHTCTAGRASGKPSAAERAQLAAADQRPLDEDVLIPAGRSQHNAWAYHELDEAGDPLHELNHRAGAETGAREEAINSNCYPCGQCRLIQERGLTMRERESLTVTLRDDDHIENFENALGFVEKELDASVSRTRGRAKETEITLGEAVNEMACAYAGIDLSECRDDE